jgi:glycosyltransferase involved in cell wall biosynthesis
MLISLIMPTLNRVHEVELFLESLRKQTFRDFELIVIDQNADRRLLLCMEAYKHFFSILYIRNSCPGLSRNRNIGLKYANGDIIAFPDDDCEYRSDTLELVNKMIMEKRLGYFILNSCDKNNLVSPSYSCTSFYMCKSKYFTVGVSYTLFIKKDLIGNFEFDLHLGCGAKFGSGEETDLILYLIKQRAIGFYSGKNFIFHPYKSLVGGDVDRAYSYAKGYGAIHRKAVSYYRYYGLIAPYMFALVKNIFGILLTKYKKYHWIALKGKLIGFAKYKKG